ncbi:NAD(P)/FAD-dependent oxidoreductase [Agitococcus lubricus]|uniref:Assimilatory nitrate reductase (NADH) beta subunit n=1 Tax=Agitococcus lubricus TaxID=1077255 RepID=A0A2T5IVM8_9GAMM|nr:FAD-dependent oxidoreductase [Agitococcus lubricus]PTQ87927.1 assimilatory nitrate reductase (NADH) beta subunit [Agitococcus lubricus]
MNKQKLVVVGNGMAGMRTVEELLTLAPDLYDITVIGKEPHGNYNRIMLSPVLAGEKTFAEIVLHSPDWYLQQGIELVSGQVVVDINRKTKQVLTDAGLSFDYDRLLLATGSVPFIIPIPNHNHACVLSFRDIRDVNTMLEVTQHKQRVAVIGGGLLGLEAANGLLKRGVDVTVIHDMPCLMNRQLDSEAAHLLQKQLEANGMKFRMGAMTKEIVALDDGHLSHIAFKNGEDLATDLVIMAVGIRPNVALAKQIGLQVDKAILVNDTMQTFDPSIYAVGECVQHRGALFGLVAPLYEQAKVCATHLAEIGIGRYVQKATATTLKVSGVNLFSAGDFSGANAETIVLRDTSSSIYKRLFIKDNKLVGAVLFGDVQDGNWYFDLIKQQQDISDIRADLVFGQ